MPPEQHPALEHLTREVPEWDEFTQLHQEFSAPFSERARMILDDLVQDRDGETLTARTIRKNVRVFGARVRAVVPQLRDNPEWEGRGATDKEFRRCARTVRKSLQEALTSPEFRVPYTRKRAEHAASETLIVDRINPTLLHNLDLGSHIPPKRMKREDQVDHMARAIPEIKDRVHALQPLKLVPTELSTRRRGQRGKRQPAIGSGLRLFTDPEGHVIGTQSPQGNGQKIMYRTDAHGAYRRIDHIREGYDKEVETLEHIKTTMARIAEQVYSNWGEAKEHLAEIQQEMTACVDKLRYVSNDHKITLRHIIASSISFKLEHAIRGKKQVRYNPGAVLARFTRIDGFVDKRIQEITSIRTYLEEDQVCVKRHIEHMRSPIQKFCETVDRLHDRFAVLNTEEELSNEQKEKISGNMMKLERQLQQPRRLPLLQPYKTFAAKMLEHVEPAREHLLTDRREEARDAFMHVYIVSRIQDLYVRLQSFYDTYLASDRLPDFEVLRDELFTLLRRAQSKKVAPESKTTQYNDFWGEVYHLIYGLLKETEKALKVEDPGMRRRDLERMRERFKKVCFEEIG